MDKKQGLTKIIAHINAITKMLSELDIIGNLELSKLEYEEFSGLFFEDDQEGGQDGTNGKDGFSPIAKVEEISGGARITITDKDGTTTVVLTNGKDGATGATGANGKDGKDGTNGKDGATGATGKSAYQSWLDLGNTGTEAEFIASLKGDKGDKGDTGANGTNGKDGAAGSAGTNGKDGAAGVDGVGVQSIELIVDAEGKVTGGTAYFTDNTSSAITITQVTT